MPDSHEPKSQSQDYPCGRSTAISIEHLLERWNQGDPEVVGELMPRVYGKLMQIARGCLRLDPRGGTLDAAALVHETYLCLTRQNRPNWQGEKHFFVVVHQMMRRLLIDHARSQSAARRGGGLQPLPLEAAQEVAAGRSSQVLALREAMRNLRRKAPEQAQLVELRVYGGFRGAEIARQLGISSATVTRRWRQAKAWLASQLGSSGFRPLRCFC